MAARKIIRIDEEKCDGCGDCVPACPEGALRIVDGKARLVSEIYCDGLGACLGKCPRGAIIIEEREAEDFDEKKTAEHIKAGRMDGDGDAHPHPPMPREAASGAGCPGAAMRFMGRRGQPPCPVEEGTTPSALANWPLQISLVHPAAPYFRDADLLLAADCVPFAFADFHRKILRGRPLVIGCPKLDDKEFYIEKLSQIVSDSRPRSLNVVVMEVPCCSGLVRIAETAIARSGMDIPLGVTVVSIHGDVIGQDGDAAVPPSWGAHVGNQP